MPEQLTKHPEVTLQVLRSAGGKCAEGARQEILTRCPAERFCKLPGGEICVYGLADAGQMTQISAAEWKALLPSSGTTEPPRMQEPAGREPLVYGGGGLLLGLAVGFAVSRIARARH
jgi:hypothetical protein